MDIKEFLNKPAIEKGNIFESFCLSYLQRRYSDREWKMTLEETPSGKDTGDYGVDIWSKKDDIYFFVQCKVRPIDKNIEWNECSNLLAYSLNFIHYENIPLENINYVFMSTSKKITKKFTMAENRFFIGYENIKEELDRYLNNLTPDIYDILKITPLYFQLVFNIFDKDEKFFISSDRIKNKEKFLYAIIKLKKINTFQILKATDRKNYSIKDVDLLFIENMNRYDTRNFLKVINEFNGFVVGIYKEPLTFF